MIKFYIDISTDFRYVPCNGDFGYRRVSPHPGLPSSRCARFFLWSADFLQCGGVVNNGQRFLSFRLYCRASQDDVSSINNGIRIEIVNWNGNGIRTETGPRAAPVFESEGGESVINTSPNGVAQVCRACARLTLACRIRVRTANPVSTENHRF
ncbi:hypothetical protein EVAR_85659_1 [Eumeta japonica]|uniref:Uncharacterized protein n=1 Tax=Eumeta variegata TaxID=151549 RepID=A0A4C1XU41_EUMVA|nr:hypothetical protein EVAR_85659_1 [Eumeta japonica]